MTDSIGKTRIDWNGLLLAAKQENKSAQNKLLNLLRERLLITAKKGLKHFPTGVPEDVVQDTLSVFWEKLNQCDRDPHKFAFIILRNRIGDELRARKRERGIKRPLGKPSTENNRHQIQDDAEQTVDISSENNLHAIQDIEDPPLDPIIKNNRYDIQEYGDQTVDPSDELIKKNEIQRCEEAIKKLSKFCRAFFMAIMERYDINN